MSERVVNCVDISGYNTDVGDVVTKHFADVGGVYGGIWYEERLTQPGLYTTNLFQAGTTSGESQVGSGKTVLANSDGKLDYLLNWGFDGRSIVFKQFTVSLGLVFIMGCTMQQPTFTTTTVSILTKDGLEKLNVPIQTETYAGTNVLPGGIDGTDDIKGSTKPLVFGPVYNITVKEVNTSKLIFQVHAGAATIPATYDMGVPLPQGSDYTDQSDMETNAPAAGTYRVWSSATYGTFARLGSSPAGAVTFDVVEGATAADRTAARIATRMALRGITSGEISASDVAALDAKNSAEVGIYIADGSTSTILQCLDQVLGSIGAWYAPDINGVLRMGRLEAPAGTPDLTLTDGTDITNLERIQPNDPGEGVPAYKVNLRYQKNWTVQTGSDLAGSVPTYSGIQIWDDSSITEMPLTRAMHSAVIYKNYMYVIGGVVGSTVTSDSVIRINLNNPVGAWDDAGVTDLPFALTNAAAVVFDHYLYVIGGVKSDSSLSASVIRLDLDNPTGAWDDAGVTDLPATRAYHTAHVYGSYLYVVGGCITSDLEAGKTNSVIRLNLTNPSGAWDDAGVTNLPVANYSHASAVDDHYLYVVGGLGSSSKVIRLDLSNPTGAWDDTGIADLPIGRAYHAVAIFRNYLYVVGGMAVGDATATTSAIRLDLSKPAGAWDDTVIVDLPENRMDSTLLSYRSSLWLSGGWDIGSPLSPTTYVFRVLVERDDALWFNQEYRTVTDQDASVQTAHLLSPELNFDTLLIDAAAAQAECTRRLNLYKVRRDMLQGDVPSSVRAFVQPGKQVKLYGPRYGLSSGKQFIEIGIVVDWQNNKTTPLLWG